MAATRRPPEAALAGRVVVVTGAGRGLGREHSLLMARLGARVVVNDSGSAIDGSGHDPGPAQAVVEEIRSAGGEAVASTDDVAGWDSGRRMIDTAVDTFGDLHVLVNNAGILRDRFLVNMTEDEWDDVVRVHLKGHFVPLRWAASYWRMRSKESRPVNASVINTTSTSGLLANPGQANYGAAKAGIAALTQIAAAELGRYGVRCNAIAPAARTRLTESTPGLGDTVSDPAWDPANVSPMVAWLATEECAVTGEVFFVHGATVQRFRPWQLEAPVTAPGGRWTVDALGSHLLDDAGGLT